MDLSLTAPWLLALEIISVLFNLLFILYLTLEDRRCWWYGFLGSMSGAWLFWEQNYKAESMLYLFYAAMAVYGYMIWQTDERLHIRRLKTTWHLLILFLGSLAALGLGKAVNAYGSDRPYFDAFSTSFGIIATFLEVYKLLSAWIYWIILNLFTVWLYAVKGMWIYAVLMLVYALLAVNGFFSWQKKLS